MKVGKQGKKCGFLNVFLSKFLNTSLGDVMAGGGGGGSLM